MSAEKKASSEAMTPRGTCQELDDAWEATGCSGTTRSFRVSLAEVVEQTRETANKAAMKFRSIAAELEAINGLLRGVSRLVEHMETEEGRAVRAMIERAVAQGERLLISITVGGAK